MNLLGMGTGLIDHLKSGQIAILFFRFKNPFQTFFSDPQNYQIAVVGVDEFMYFLKGGVTLTSSDGQVTTITVGDAVTIPKEWTGVWDTEGYTKIWEIYSEDGSGL